MFKKGWVTMYQQMEAESLAGTVLVVGADHLGSIPRKLAQKGVQHIIHWSGRSRGCLYKTIPQEVDAIILYWDFINHGLMNNIRRQAKERSIPLIYNRRKSGM